MGSIQPGIQDRKQDATCYMQYEPGWSENSAKTNPDVLKRRYTRANELRRGHEKYTVRQIAQQIAEEEIAMSSNDLGNSQVDTLTERIRAYLTQTPHFKNTKK